MGRLATLRSGIRRVSWACVPPLWGERDFFAAGGKGWAKRIALSVTLPAATGTSALRFSGNGLIWSDEGAEGQNVPRKTTLAKIRDMNQYIDGLLDPTCVDIRIDLLWMTNQQVMNFPWPRSKVLVFAPICPATRSVAVPWFRKNNVAFCRENQARNRVLFIPH